MFTLRSRYFAALAFAVFVSCAPAHGQEAQPTPSTSPSPRTETARRNSVFSNRIFDVRNREPEILADAIRGLGSGAGGAGVTHNTLLRTITVRDFPENIAVMEDALRRLDVPEAPRADIELRVSVLIASNDEGTSAQQLPTELRDVVTQLQSTLNYRNYYLATTLFQRTRDRARNISSGGTTQTAASAPDRIPISQYQMQIESISVTNTQGRASTVQIQEFRFTLNGSDGIASVRTDISLRDGERVVVGTASLRDKALILVLSARVAR